MPSILSDFIRNAGERLTLIVIDEDGLGQPRRYQVRPTVVFLGLGAAALEPAVRAGLLERGRAILRENLDVLETWAEGHAGVLRFARPRAGAVAFFHYDLPIGSTELAERLLAEQSVLIVPGDQFKMDHYLRIGYGGEPEVLTKGLALFTEMLESVGSKV